MLISIGIGAMAAIVLTGLNHNRKLDAQVKLWGQALLIAALIYVGFNIYGQAWALLPIELSGVLVYTVLALLAWKHHPVWLALGWLLHVGWDMGVHPLDGANYVPNWYPALCLGFDLVVGSYLLGLIWTKLNAEKKFNVSQGLK